MVYHTCVGAMYISNHSEDSCSMLSPWIGGLNHLWSWNFLSNVPRAAKYCLQSLMNKWLEKLYRTSRSCWCIQGNTPEKRQSYWLRWLSGRWRIMINKDVVKDMAERGLKILFIINSESREYCIVFHYVKTCGQISYTSSLSLPMHSCMS